MYCAIHYTTKIDEGSQGGRCIWQHWFKQGVLNKLVTKWISHRAEYSAEWAAAGPAVPIHSLKGGGGVPTTIDTLPQMHIHTALTSTPSPLFTPLIRHPKCPPPPPQQLCALTLSRGRISALPLSAGEQLLTAVTVERQPWPFCWTLQGDSPPLTCVHVKQPFNASTISPPPAASCAFFSVR